MNEYLEDLAKTNYFEAGLETLAHNAYQKAKDTNTTLKSVLKQPKYNELTKYYSYDSIINDLLKYV